MIVDKSASNNNAQPVHPVIKWCGWKKIRNHFIYDKDYAEREGNTKAENVTSVEYLLNLV